MGNQTSNNSKQKIRQLKKYEQVSRTNDGIIYRSRPGFSSQETTQYFILKQHNYHNHQSYQQAYKKYSQSMTQTQAQQSSTLSIRQVVEQQMQHFCSNTYKIYVLYEYPELTLKDEIQVRAKEGKYFEECEIVAILQTCVLAMEEIKATICFGSNLIYISPDGVIKVTHNDLVDENYRHVVTNKVYYAPQKITNFMNEATSEIVLKKQVIFSMGMALLEACRLEAVHDVYDYTQHKINEGKLAAYIESLTQRYSTELVDLVGNMLETNPNRRISLLEVQRALNRFDELQGDQLNEEDQHIMKQKQKQQLQNKCQKLFVYQGKTLPRIKESNESNQQPSIPNILSHQNSSRVSLTKNHNSKGTNNNSEEFYHNLDNSIQGYKINCRFGGNTNCSEVNNMTAHFQQPFQPPNITHPTPTDSKDHLFTDPKLLQMIRQDLQQISKSRTSRIMYGSQHSSISYVNTSQNVQKSTTNRYAPPPNYQDYSSNNGSTFNASTFDRYANSNKTFTEYTILQNCPQVQSLAASVAYDNCSSGDKNNNKNYVYQDSDVKCHPENRMKQEQNNMKVSIALSSKNFTLARKNETETLKEPQTVRYPLREVSQNPAKSLSSVQQQIKAAMMKKKQSNLVYLEEFFQDGVKYQGMSKNGMKQGYGKLLYNDGAYYQGYFHNDKINGKGTLYYKKDSPAYDGEWLDEQFHGYGQLYNEEPQELEEEFPFHNWNFLENYWTNYQGEFMNDLKHGKGKIVLTSDEWIEGQFEDDMLNGWARFYKTNGQCIEGRYENNVLVELRND